MLVHDGSGWLADKYDTVAILHNKNTKHFHVAVFEGSPMPYRKVYLRCKMSHTQGAPSLEEAIVQMDEVIAMIDFEIENIHPHVYQLDWSGERDNVSLVMEDWRERL